MAMAQPLSLDNSRENTIQSREMATSEPKSNQRKKMAFQGRNGAIKFTTGGGGNDNNGVSEDLRRLCKQGRLKEALHILHVMNQCVDSPTYVCLLQVCIKRKALSEGKLVHAHMSKRGSMTDRIVENTLVNMYAKCGSMVEARRVFDQMPKRDVISWTVMIAAYVRHGLSEEALELFHQMQRTGIQPNQFTFASVLSACANLAILERGMEIHEAIIRSGSQSNVFVESALVDMYAKCGRIGKARQVFDKMYQRNLVSWNTMIAAYTMHGLSEEALILFNQMEQLGIRPDRFTFSSVLAACANIEALDRGIQIHEDIIRNGLQCNIFVGNALVDMYSKCGSLKNARNFFDEMHQRNTISWTVMIAAYTRHGFYEEALTLFHQMQRSDIQPDHFTFANAITACANLAALEQGMKIHEDVIKSGFQSDGFVDSALVEMYAKCGIIEKARHIFDQMHRRKVVSWNMMIAAYTRHGLFEEALALFHQMQQFGVQPDQFTFASVLPACANLEALEQGMEIHADILKSGFQSNVFVESALVDMYAKCESMEEARNLFEKMHQRNVVSWNTMIAAYSRHGLSEEALTLFHQMQRTGIQPDQSTFASVLPACGNLAALEQGMAIHEEIVRSGFQSDVIVGNALVDMYTKCRSIEEARNLFDKMHQRNVVSWNTMIAAYTRHGLSEEALTLFHQMQCTGMPPDAFTFTSVLPACANLAALERGRDIHKEIIRSGFQSDVTVGNALVDMYAKCGSIDDARDLFDKMPRRSTVSWTAMIAAYTRYGLSVEALTLFHQMQGTGIEPDQFTFASVLLACSNLASLKQGMEIHQEIIRSGFESNVSVGNALVDMYAKCGSIEDARNFFDKMHPRNAISWTTMIGGYAIHGYGKEALTIFEEMQLSGMKPDHVTLVCVLSACSHAGLLNEGRQYFDCMIQYYHITPTMEHYVCMVDLLGRAGHLDEAQEFINKMPIKPDSSVWRCLLGACRMQNNVELGERVAESLFELDPKNATPYVLLSNIYAAAGRWNDSGNVRRMMKDRRIKKMPGCSWIEVNKQVHVFLVGDRSHPQTEQIYAKLERLCRQMKVAGYVPDTRFVLRDVDDEQKEQIIFHHSEKLAIVFGIINMSPGTVIRVIKNLRVCSDCHSATKFISKILGREILVRDANRFHHFKDGKCSCGDYW